MIMRKGHLQLRRWREGEIVRLAGWHCVAAWRGVKAGVGAVGNRAQGEERKGRRRGEEVSV